MIQILRNRSPHAGRLERFIGAQSAEDISRAMDRWYYKPIAVANVPGAVYARKGGDFVGKFEGGYYSTLSDLVEERARRALKRQGRTMNAGFGSLSAIIAAATQNNGSRFFAFNKGSLAVAAGAGGTLFYSGVQPSAGAIASAAPGGTTQSSTTTGAFPFTNPTGGATQHLVSGAFETTVAGNTVLFYDRLFSVAKTMNSTASESVTSLPTRYQSITASDANYVGGNFAFPEAVTTIANTAHNWATCSYLDQGGASSNFASIAGRNSAAAGSIDLALGNWFMPLAAGDVGVQALTALQVSAAVATGTLAVTIGHPLAFLPSGPANVMMPFDGINSAFNLVRVFDDACMSLLDLAHAV